MITSKRMLFLVAAVGLAVAGLVCRAATSHSATAQVEQILSSDTAGIDVTPKISNLKVYANEHMGASASFTLKGSYNRAVAAAQTAAAAASNSSQVYADAQRACSSKSDSLVQAHCNQAYLAAHLTNVPTTAPVLSPVLANYQYQVTSPAWTPDLAGALFLGALVAFVLSLAPGRRKGPLADSGSGARLDSDCAIIAGLHSGPSAFALGWDRRRSSYRHAGSAARSV